MESLNNSLFQNKSHSLDKKPSFYTPTEGSPLQANYLQRNPEANYLQRNPEKKNVKRKSLRKSLSLNDKFNNNDLLMMQKQFGKEILFFGVNTLDKVTIR